MVVKCYFAGKKITIVYDNKKRLDYGSYRIGDVFLNGKPIKFEKLDDQEIKIKRSVIKGIQGQSTFRIILTS